MVLTYNNPTTFLVRKTKKKGLVHIFNIFLLQINIFTLEHGKHKVNRQQKHLLK